METFEIIQIEKSRRDQYILTISNHDPIHIDQETIIYSNLYKGKHLSSDEIQSLSDKKERNRVYQAAIRFLGVRSRTEKEIRIKLEQKNFNPIWINWTIDKLIKDNYINHQVFAEQFTSDAIHLKKKGVNWVRYELKMRGIEEEYISQALSKLNTEHEMESAFLLSEKKWNQLIVKNNEYDAKMKLKVFLMRRGYGEQVIREVINKLLNLT